MWWAQQSEHLKLNALPEHWMQRNPVQSAKYASAKYAPATAAVMKQATLPAIIARNTRREMSPRRAGAIAPIAPIIIPIEPGFAKPHSAYVAIISDFSCARESARLFATFSCFSVLLIAGHSLFLGNTVFVMQCTVCFHSSRKWWNKKEASVLYFRDYIVSLFGNCKIQYF